MSVSTVRKVRVRGSLGPRAFYGVSLSEVTTESPYRPRWIELALYREWEVELGADGAPLDPLVPIKPGGYVLHRVGRSLVYHAEGSDCNTGVPVEVRDLAEDSEPCNICHPPDLEDLEDGTIVDQEEDRPAIERCATPEELLEHLQDPRAPAGSTASAIDRLSAPAQRLLRRAAPHDDGIAAITEAVRWL